MPILIRANASLLTHIRQNRFNRRHDDRTFGEVGRVRMGFKVLKTPALLMSTLSFACLPAFALPKARASDKFDRSAS